MDDTEFPRWNADIHLDKSEVSIEYKYAIYDHDEKKIIEWELGENRFISRE